LGSRFQQVIRNFFDLDPHELANAQGCRLFGHKAETVQRAGRSRHRKRGEVIAMLQAHEAPRRPSRSGFRAGSCEFVPKHGLIGFLLWKCRAWQKKSAGWAMHCFGARGSRVHRVVGEIVWVELALGFSMVRAIR
jgi:hypothetical protein